MAKFVKNKNPAQTGLLNKKCKNEITPKKHQILDRCSKANLTITITIAKNNF